MKSKFAFRELQRHKRLLALGYGAIGLTRADELELARELKARIATEIKHAGHERKDAENAS